MINNLKKYTVYIYTSFLFLASITLFVYIYPKNKQNKYEFSKGDIWQGEDLIAENDFPIKKTENEIIAEIDSIKNNLISLYYIDTIVEQNVYAYFVNEIEFLKRSEFSNETNNNSNEIQILNNFSNNVLLYISKCYQKGVVQILQKNKKNNSTKIKIKTKDRYDMHFVSDFYSSDSIKKHIYKYYSKISVIDSLNNFPIQNILSKFQLEPNIILDEKASDQYYNDQLSSVAKYSGMVKKGELIAKKGDVINADTFKKLKSLNSDNSTTQNSFTIGIGIILLYFLLYFGVYFLYFYIYKKDQLFRLRNNTFFTFQFLSVIIFTFVLSKFNFEGILNINFIPYTLFAALLISFFDFSVAFFVYFFILLLSCFFASNGFEFIFTQSIAGMICMYSLRIKQKRQQLFVALLCVVISYIAVYIGFYLMRGNQFSLKDFFSNQLYTYLISSGLLLGYFPLIYIYEKIFGFLSDFTLNELCDTNNNLLKELSEKAPGTFYHSLQVANLVEAVVRKLNGDVLLARTGALYHDIGKIKNPEYFIENQHGENIHNKLSFEDSATKIISHINNGIEIAEANYLPLQIRNFIRTHHGTTLTKYFYNSWKNNNPDKKPDINKFQYPGPKPKSIETTVVMMADAIEAASRTLKYYSQETIMNIVNNIVDNLIADEQFNEVDITLKQINEAKQIFVTKLLNIYHARIVYPE